MRVFIVASCLTLSYKFNILKDTPFVMTAFLTMGVVIAVLQDIKEFLPKIIEDRRK